MVETSKSSQEETDSIFVVEKEITWFEPIVEHALWHHVCGPFGAKFIFIDDIEHEDIKKLVPKGYTTVALCETGDTLLKNFKHPKKAVYFLGRTSQGDKTLPGKIRLRIDTPNDICLFGHVAAGIVLNDRFLKKK